MTMGEARDRKPELYGVWGWLLFLCIILMVITPIQMALIVVSMLRSTSDSTALGLAYLAFLLAFYGFGATAGVLLYREKPLGLKLAKIFFCVRILLSGGAILSAPNLIVEMSALQLAMAVGIPGAWLLYLYRSERVRNTYSENTVRDAAEVFR